MKYYLSVCCIIKDEQNLEEFIMYHHIQGVEHFYIYDNESKIPISTRLNYFYFKKLCTIIHFPGITKQMPAYDHCMKNYKNETKWLMVIDGDEYVLPKKHKNLRDFLKDYEDYQAIGINWVMFGTSFHDKKQNGLLVDKFRYRDANQNRHIKSIVQTQYTLDYNHPHFGIIKDKNKYVDAHKRVISGPFNSNRTIDIIQINHYVYRSAEERRLKCTRGRSDVLLPMTYSNHKNIHDDYNDVIENILPDRYASLIRSHWSLVGMNPTIYKELNPDLKLNTEEEYYDHAFNHSINEKRPLHINDKYPNFNRAIYRKNYPTLINMDDLRVDLHYITIGVKEKRIADKLL